jgi:predicted nucleotidyltransferase component of viral defense system
MTREKKSNIPASILARLLVRSKKTGDEYQTVLTAYVCERFLFRLAASPVRDRFVLKGAMLLRIWSDHPYRMTRDLDLLRRGDPTAEAIARDIESICRMPVDPDGLDFDTKSIQLEAIRAEDEFVGTRVTMRVYCGKARIALQVDIGVGDTVYPAPRLEQYATLLDMPEPEVFAYAPESVIAEKLEATLVLGERNSRIKDFFDLRYLAQNFTFDRTILVEAIRSTFARRNTPIPPDDPIGLTDAYWENPMRPAQVRAFARRSGLEADTGNGKEILAVIRPFLIPVLDDLRRGIAEEGTWPPGGPWR